MIEVKDLRVDFWLPGKRLQAVRGVSFEIGDDEIVGLVGESGSGKSVTAAALLQLHRPPQAAVSGSILTDGVESSSLKLSRLPAYRSEHFGYIAQEPSQSFDPLYTIERNFLEMFRIKNPKISKKEARMRAVALLNEVGIARPEERLRGFPHQFSGGMLQRIMIALALGGEGRVLIADEPTTALDVTVQAQIVRLLLDLKKKRHFSVLFISHDLELVSAVADRILVIYGGLILEAGRAEEIRRRPLCPYTQELLKSILHPGIIKKTEECHTITGTPPDPLNPEPGCPFEPRCPKRFAECKKAVPPLKGSNHLYRCLLSETQLTAEGADCG